MSIPNEALQKVSIYPPRCFIYQWDLPDHGRTQNDSRCSQLSQLLQEIETRALASQQQIGITKAQLTAKQRDIRMQQLTSKELSDLPSETRVYEGVGKM